MRTIQTYPNTVLLLLLFAPMVIMIFLLGNTATAGGSRLINTIIFAILLLGSLIGLAFQKLSNRMPEQIKWFGGIKPKGLLWIAGGYVAVLLVSYFLTPFNVVAAIIISGGIMFVALFRTESILVPIAIHGFYNATVLLMTQGIVSSLVTQSTSPIRVPSVGIDDPQINMLLTESIFQFMVVAPAEEFVKLSAAVGLAIGAVSILGIEGRAAKYVGAVFAVALWSFAHLIVAIRV